MLQIMLRSPHLLLLLTLFFMACQPIQRLPETTSPSVVDADANVQESNQAQSEIEVKLQARPAAIGKPIVGFADLHTHHMGHLNFDGEWLVGQPSGPIATALAACTENDLHGLAAGIGRKGHLQTVQGYPSFREWPTWDNIAHQSIYESWLRKAHQEGLKLMVVSFTNFEPFCRALKLIKFRKDMVEACRDMRIVQRQYDEVIKFAATHPWYVIVKTPAEARTVIAEGKLAVVLAIEVSNLFDEEHGFGTWQEQLDLWYKRGVRSLIITHEIDNRFGRAATHDDTFWWFDLLKSHKNLDDQQTLLTQIFTPHVNQDAGLTDKGEALIEAMMKKGMLIDVAHLDTSGINEVIALTQKNAFYPFFNSHTYLHETMTEEQKQKTKHINARVVNAIKQSGGVVGLRTGPEEQVGYKPGDVDNTCHGSSRSFAQGYAFATMALDVPVAFGTDMNGMIESLGPRFASGNDSCTWAYQHCSTLQKLIGACNAYKDERTMQQAIQGSAATNGISTDFDTMGFARYDHMNDLVMDLDKLGLNTAPLYHAAENFIRMWERTEQTNRTPLSGVGEFKNGRCGSDQSDFECEMTKEQRDAWAKAQKKEGYCKNDGECGEGLFCDTGTLTLGTNTCKRRLTDGSMCSRDEVCASHTCVSLRCITPQSKVIGAACYVNQECRDGKCSAALFGAINGKCVCDVDSDCADSQYCYYGFADIGTNECRAKKSDGQACIGDGQCASGHCSDWRPQDGQVSGICYTPNSKDGGESCQIDLECRAGKCNSSKHCVCGNDDDCKAGFWCDKGLDSSENSCKPKLDKGEVCGTVGELGAGHRCKSGSCKADGIFSTKLTCQ